MAWFCRILFGISLGPEVDKELSVIEVASPPQMLVLTTAKAEYLTELWCLVELQEVVKKYLCTVPGRPYCTYLPSSPSSVPHDFVPFYFL